MLCFCGDVPALSHGRERGLSSASHPPALELWAQSVCAIPLGKQEPRWRPGLLPLCALLLLPFSSPVPRAAPANSPHSAAEEGAGGLPRGAGESSQGSDSWLWERDKNWGKMKCSYFNKDPAHAAVPESPGSAAVLWVTSPEGFVKHFSLSAQKC